MTMLEQIPTTVSYLYVEDNDYLRLSICDLIEQPHRAVTAVDCAELALPAIELEAFDVLITDVSLPGMSGMELARRWLAADPGRWVVICSGSDFRGALQVLGPNVRALTKPFEIEELELLLVDIETRLRTRGTC